MLVSSLQVSIQKARKITLVAFNATKPTTRHCNKGLAMLIKTISSYQLKTITA
jgi:hypothetical protein